MLSQRMSFNGKKVMENDNVFVENSITDAAKLFGMPTRKGYEQAIISNGKLVNLVSNSYGHLPNEQFFLNVEENLINADVQYDKRSINRQDRSFAVDYILNDENYIIDVANGKDIIKPMLRFVNSYDGSNKTSGNFGYFRQVCTNGLHVAEFKMSFSVKHKGNICEFVLPEIKGLISAFMNNEYYSLKAKADILSEKRISDVQAFVKKICDETNIFKFEKSDKNAEPSLNAQIVMETIASEANYLQIEPNYWLGYNAMNEILHDKFNKSFEVQKSLDGQIFNAITDMAMVN